MIVGAGAGAGQSIWWRCWLVTPTEETPVRVRGWLMLDTEHPDHVGRYRGAKREIHPIIGVEVLRDGESAAFDPVAPAPPLPSPDDEEESPETIDATFIDKNCGDFATQFEAQAFYEAEGVGGQSAWARSRW